MPSVRLPQSLAGRIAAIVAAAVVLVLVLSQIFLPGIGEGAIEDRLTKNGGAADASLSARPAARLLWGSGDEIGIDATGLDLEVTAADEPVVFDDLDRFGDVEIIIRDSSMGPVDMEDFVLTRKGDEPYSIEAHGTTSASDLAQFGAEAFDLPGADILGGILSVATGGTEVDVDLDMLVESDDGRVHVLEGGGEVAGIPTGPLAAFITSAVTIEI
ncbi:MAG TPA: hypothetical protein VD766_11115 [Solirubrobacterales bacterium]|nr:hypothetical protein [Solirubrobacterales bacterium]